MDVVLLILMVASLAAAVAFGVIAWRVVREERARSVARVASLSDALDGASASVTEAGPYGRSLFERRDRLTGRPMMKAAVAAAMTVVVVAFATMGKDEDPDDRLNAEVARSAQSAPLELMSMRHARAGSTLTVTGLVRNPPAGVEARRVTAVVFAFDRSGSFVGSARAPLDFMVLQPDDESPFVVTLPDAADVTRYRVSFRTDEGLLRHLDRRANQMQLAGNR